MDKIAKVYARCNPALRLFVSLKFSALISVTFLVGIAQICRAQDASGNSSWTASSQQQSPAGAENPFRTRETHTAAGGRVVDNKSIETLGPDGRYIPYRDTETESVRVDATTFRTTERTFGRGPDGERQLVQVRTEESRELAGGEHRVERTVLDPDANGTLQVVQRELQDSRQISPDVRETKTTVLTPDVNGGLSPVVQIEERQKKSSDGVIEFKKSTQLADGAGHWQLAEIREGTRKQGSGEEGSAEERVLRPDSNGNLTVVERTVSKQTEPNPGEKRDTTETYSVNVPGTASDGSLQLVQRETTVQRNTAGGAQTSTKKTEQLNPGAPSDGLQLTNEAIDIVRPAAGGNADQSSTILAVDPDGRLREVWVDFGKTDKPSTTQTESPTSTKPK